MFPLKICQYFKKFKSASCQGTESNITNNDKDQAN
jgi:hypothetical protein